MKSWLRDDEQVTARFVQAGTVTVVWGGDDLLFDACVGTEPQRAFDGSWLAPDERALVVKGARFWLVQEHPGTPGSGTETWCAIRFARPGATSAAAAFGVGGEAA